MKQQHEEPALKMTPFTASPILWTSLGAALSYYGIAPAENQTRIILAAGVLLLVCLARVLLATPWICTEPSWQRPLRIARTCILALTAGLCLGLGAGSSRPLRPGLLAYNGLCGTLEDDPRAITGGQGMGYLSLSETTGPGGLRASASGRILVLFPEETLSRLKDIGRGADVYVEGVLLNKQRENGDPLFRAKSLHIQKAAPGIETTRTRVRAWIAERFKGSPWGGLSLALLLGMRDNLDTTLARSYQYAGCSHVLALSGMHLAIIAGLLAFLLKRPLGLRAAALTGMIVISLYVYLVGNLPSLNRAAIMYLLGTLAVLGFIPRQPIVLLALSFLIQISVFPPHGESGRGVSFILSYLALGGILLIGEAIHDLIRGIIPELLAKPLPASLGAFLATAGAVSVFFGVLRPIGILAGLIIVPLTTVFMILSLVSLLPLVSGPLGFLLTRLYDMLEGLASLAALVPGVEGDMFLLTVAVSVALVLLSRWMAVERLKVVPFSKG
jgi:competence protein ComEC